MGDGETAVLYRLSAIGCRQRKPYDRACGAMEKRSLFGACGTTFPPLKRGDNKRGEKNLTPQACP